MSVGNFNANTLHIYGSFVPLEIYIYIIYIIALTNHLTKISKESKNLMNPTQHGFRSGPSTITQLLSYFDKAIKWMRSISTLQTL